MSEFLKVGSATVPVVVGGAERQHRPLGDYGRAFAGNPLGTARGWAAEGQVVQTMPIPTADATTLLTALRGTPPVAITGTWCGSISVVITGITERSDYRAGGQMRVVTFSYMEPAV